MTPPVVPASSREIVIDGLEKAQDVMQVDCKVSVDEPSQPSTFSTIMDENVPLTELWARIEDCGFQKPVTLKIDNVRYREDNDVRVVSNHEEVVVVADDQLSTKHTIRITETLISHANTHHGQAIDFNIAPPHSSKRAVEANCGFHVSLERTPRMPDDNKLHQLPGSLGSYDLFSVESHADRLPKNIREDGGVFFPMWQREAMWLNFEPTEHKCAVRVFMGHVNAISGLTMEESADQEGNDQKQDYIVIPGQRWLDGICVAPGIVRQFVAMPLGSGYTVEGQKTSKEKHGGLQLEITPAFLPRQRLWSYSRDNYLTATTYGLSRGLDETMTPQQLHCTIGDVLRSYPADRASEEPLMLKHLANPGTTIACTAINGVYSGRAVYGELTFASCVQSSIKEKDSPPVAVSTSTKSHPIGMSTSTGPNWDDEYGSGSIEWDLPAMAHQELLSSIAEAGVSCDNEFGEEISKVDSVEPEVIVARDIKAMGLAAGGKLIQDIYKDPYPATIWNHAAARILHMHILDSVSCEKVTHIVPKPPSMDAKAYTEAFGNFFVVEEKVDERLDGGDFDNVKSVSQMDQHVGISTEPEFDPTKPKMCTTCELRLCDCIIRPCDHQFCNVCIKRIEQDSDEDVDPERRNWKCPTCDSPVSHVAGFSAPMNLPGEEPLRIKVPVNVLKIEDGRVRFESVQKTRI